MTVEGQVKDALLNGDTENYNGEQGYTTHTIMRDSSKGITVQLGQPFLLNCIRMLLWDRDNRSYSYYVQVACVCVCPGSVCVCLCLFMHMCLHAYVCMSVCVLYLCKPLWQDGDINNVLYVTAGISGPGALGDGRGPLRASVSILAGAVF